MKKILLLLFMFCCMSLKAQNYLINFSGTGATSTVSTVKVENLMKNTSITLNGSDILQLTGMTDIRSIETTSPAELRIYPNPMQDAATLLFLPAEAGYTTISIIDMTGRISAIFQGYLEKAIQEFRVSNLKSGFYLVQVKGNSFQFSGKLLCNGKSSGKIGIVKTTNSTKNEYKVSYEYSKGSKSVVDMEYSPGDRLKYTGISGIYSTVVTDIPAYSKTVQFEFVRCSDFEGNNYPVVHIGSQIWMGENLKSTKYNEGTNIPLVTDQAAWEILWTPGFCWYGNDVAANKNIYGALYNWYTTSAGKLCPQGWRVPSSADWTALCAFLGGESVSGGKLKGTNLWNTPNSGANNETGFTGLGGGYRVFDFSYINVVGRWWTLTESWSRAATGIQLINNATNVYFEPDLGKNAGFSVRCIKGALPLVSTSGIGSISSTTGIVGGIVSSDGESTVSERGVFWGTSGNAELNGTKLQCGNGIGTFSSSLSGLNANTIYYIRAYATNSNGTALGTEITFRTNLPTAPALTTNAATTITQTTAISGGNVTDDGGAAITSRGVCWSTSSNPTIANSKTSDGNGKGNFSSNLTGLSGNTTYHIRAYATNSQGTSYGNDVLFSTLPVIPTVTTSAISSVTNSAATSGGSIVKDGGSPVTDRGICWSTTSNPTIELPTKTSNGTGTGSFISNLSSLDPLTTYFVRAFATNSIGTAYGPEVSFKTRSTVTVTDVDGNVYNTVTYGTQTWMAENLRTTRYSNGVAIGTTIPYNLNIFTESYPNPKYQWAYEGNESNVASYGRLYTWGAAVSVCPTGWHLPTDAEWSTLENNLIANGYNYDGTTSGNKIAKSMASASSWLSSTSIGTVGNSDYPEKRDAAKFAAVPVGRRRVNGTFYPFGREGVWWTATKYDDLSMWYRGLGYNAIYDFRNSESNQSGLSVRCVKN